MPQKEDIKPEKHAGKERDDIAKENIGSQSVCRIAGFEKK